MPIDTRAKRQNVAEIGCPLSVAVLPAGIVDNAARAQITWTYRGIAIRIQSPPPSDRTFLVADAGESSVLPDAGTSFIVPESGEAFS